MTFVPRFTLAVAHLFGYRQPNASKPRFKLVPVELVAPGRMFMLPADVMHSAPHTRMFAMWHLDERYPDGFCSVKAFCGGGCPITLICGKYVAIRIA